MVFELESALLYFNTSILIIIGSGALFGFFRGFFKSAYDLIVFIALLLTGWFLSPLIVKELMAVDITQYYSFEINGIIITSINESIPQVAESFLPEITGLITPTSPAYLLIHSTLSMTLRIVVMIIWLILMGTIFRFIFWIIYRIIRPKAKTKNGKKVGKGLFSRLSGSMIGGLHALILILLFSIPLSGLTSIGHSLVQMLPEEEDVSLEEVKETTEIYNPIDLDQFEEVFKFMATYRETLSGKIGSFINISGDPVDEYLFDELLSLKINQNKVKLKNELQTALRIYNLFGENLDQLFDSENLLENLSSLDKEVLEVLINEASKLQIAHVGALIGLEYLNKNGKIDFINEGEYQVLYQVLEDVNFENEIKNLGSAFIIVLELNLLESEIEPQIILSLNGERIDELFSKLGNLESIDLIATLGINFLLNSNQVFFEELGIDLDSLEFDLKWGDELDNLDLVFKALTALGITYDSETEKYVLSSITDESINSFSEAVFNSKFLSDNNMVLAKLMVSLLPMDYQNVFSIDSFTKNDFTSLLSLTKVFSDAGVLVDDMDFDILLSYENTERISKAISESALLSSNISSVLEILLKESALPFEVSKSSLERDWSGEAGKTEITALFEAARELIDLGLSGEDFLNNLDSEKIDSLTEKITASDVLMGNIDNLLDYLFVQKDGFGNIQIDISSVSEMNWNSEEGKNEFKNIMQAVSVILEANLHQEPDLKMLSDGTEDINEDGIIDETDNLIKRLAKGLSSSILIRNNLSNIIYQILSDQAAELSVVVFDSPDDWTEPEIESLFLATKIIMGKERLPEDLFSLTDSELDVILRSNLITQSMVETLIALTSPEGQLYNLLIITNVGEDDWYDKYQDGLRYDGELRRLFNSSKLLLGSAPNFDDTENLISLNRVLEINDEEMDDLTESIILRDSIANKLIEMGTDGEAPAVLEVNLLIGDPAWKTEIKSLIKATKTLLGDEVDLDALNLDINTVKSLTDEDIDIILNSIIITDTVIKKLIEIGENAEGGLVINLDKDDPAWRKGPQGEGELKSFLKAVNTLLEEDDDLNDPNVIDINRITSLSETEIELLSSSLIIVDTAVKHINELTSPTGSLYNIVYLPELENEDYYGTDGEFKDFMIALQYLLNENAEDGNLDTLERISISSLIGENQAKILSSKIIKETIIKSLENEALKPDSIIKIAPELNREGSDYQNGSWDEELPKLLDAISIIIGSDGSIDNINVNQNDFLQMSDDEINIITSSRIFALTAVKTIETESKNEASLISLPNDLNPDASEYNEVLWYGTEGELVKALKAMRELGLINFNDDINISILFTEVKGETEEVILASRVVEATIINKIEVEAATGGSLEGVLIVPEDAVWNKTSDDEGELRRFLRAIEIIIGEGSFETATFEVDKFFGPDQETLLASKLVEASIINKIEIEAASGGTLEGVLIVPEDVVWNKTMDDEGELRRFLRAIEILIGEGSFEATTFEVDKFLGSDQETLLGSRVVEASAISFIITSDKLTIPDATDLRYYYFEDENLVWEKTENDEGELRRFFAGVKVLLGEDSFEDFDFAMGNLLTVDFEIALKSRVLEATLADMISNLIDGGALSGLIKEPDNGYQWYYHKTSTDSEAGVVRRGEFDLNGNIQSSDLSGFLEAIQAMKRAGLSFDNINMATISNADTLLLADAFCDYSRVIGGSIATMLNYVLKDVEHPMKPTFTDEDISYQDKQTVIAGLNGFKTFVNNI